MIFQQLFNIEKTFPHVVKSAVIAPKQHHDKMTTIRKQFYNESVTMSCYQSKFTVTISDREQARQPNGRQANAQPSLGARRKGDSEINRLEFLPMESQDNQRSTAGRQMREGAQSHNEGLICAAGVSQEAPH